jgi:tetratricopeptide (TPR) repeat protein
MRKTNWLMAAGLAALMAAHCSSSRKAPEKIEFMDDFEQAKGLAAQKSQPLLLLVYSENCPWCRMLDDSTFSDPNVIELSASAVFARLDSKQDSALAKSLGVAYYPTVIVFKPGGAEADRLVGYYPPAEFYNQVQLYLQGSETLQDYLTRLEDEPNRTEYLLIVAEKYRNRADWNKAAKYYIDVTSLKPENIGELEEATLQLAGVYAQKGEYAAAISGYEAFMLKFPGSKKAEEADKMLPYCWAKSGDYKKALTLFETYLQKYPHGKYRDWVTDRIREMQDIIAEGM